MFNVIDFSKQIINMKTNDVLLNGPERSYLNMISFGKCRYNPLKGLRAIETDTKVSVLSFQ